MGFACLVNGPCMSCQWALHVLPMGLACLADGPCMSCQWALHVLSTGLACLVDGPCMSCRRALHVMPIVTLPVALSLLRWVSSVMLMVTLISGRIVSVVSMALFARYFMFFKLSTCFIAQVFSQMTKNVRQQAMYVMSLF